jgi:hypothetical protein
MKQKSGDVWEKWFSLMTTFHKKTNHVEMSSFQNSYTKFLTKNPKLLFMDAKDKEQGRGKTEKHIETDIWSSIMEYSIYFRTNDTN